MIKMASIKNINISYYKRITHKLPRKCDNVTDSRLLNRNKVRKQWDIFILMWENNYYKIGYPTRLSQRMRLKWRHYSDRQISKEAYN